MRGVNYTAAATALVFTGLWFLFGVAVQLSPIPGTLGIGSEMFVAWVLLFFVILGIAGATLTLAAINGIFPRTRRTNASYASAPPSRQPTAPDPRLPWSASPLPPAKRGDPTTDRAARIASDVRRPRDRRVG